MLMMDLLAKTKVVCAKDYLNIEETSLGCTMFPSWLVINKPEINVNGV